MENRIEKILHIKIAFGNVNSKRDWCHAQDYVKAMWLILQKDEPDDYVVGTCVEHSVEEFARKAFEHVNLNYKDYITIDNDLIRPEEVNVLLANYSKAKKHLKWKPEVTFDNLVIDMVESDLELTKDYKYY